MPMLMTLRIRFPVCPRHWPLPNLLRENGHPVKYCVHLGHDIDAVDENLFALRRAQGEVKNGPILRDVDLPALEHGLDVLTQSALLGELHEKTDRLVGDAVLRVVEVKTGTFDGHPLAAKCGSSAKRDRRCTLRTFQ